MSPGTGTWTVLVDRGDLDGLTRAVDRLCHDGAWDELGAVRDGCRGALQRGRQLWPVVAYAEYRLALEAPGPWAAAAVMDASGRFTLGPLTEVVAARHGWSELVGGLRPGPAASLVAHERVVRGEDLRGDALAVAGAGVVELPLVLAPWEPAYPVATYEADRAGFPAPPLPALAPVRLPPAAPTTAGGAAAAALRDVVAGWTADSGGRAEVVAVAGTAAGAVAALGPPAARMAAVDPAMALAWLSWAGASGGAHGRRRGMATGRFAAWWAVAALAGRLDDWPLPPAEMGRCAAALNWHGWDAAEPVTGWSLHLAVEDPGRGLAWALAATDAALSGP